MTARPTAPVHLFVYGTLRPGDVRWPFLERFVADTGVDPADGVVRDRVPLPGGCTSLSAEDDVLVLGTSEIIDEVEPHRRGPYAGAVGYIDFNGNMDTCIALRTIVIQGDTAYVQAGAGMVADSVPTNEWNETLNKARGLLKAIDLAEKREESDE